MSNMIQRFSGTACVAPAAALTVSLVGSSRYALTAGKTPVAQYSS
ncbi:MAG: hypothetical protein ABI967_08470 [bacterium]